MNLALQVNPSQPVLVVDHVTTAQANKVTARENNSLEKELLITGWLSLYSFYPFYRFFSSPAR